MSRDLTVDALVDSLASSEFELTPQIPVLDTDREHPNSRLAMWKNRGKTMGSNQEVRRRALLKHQKARRAEALEVARALVEGDVVEDEDDDDEIGKGSGSDESMMMEATDEASVVKKYRVRASYKKQLMLSEWMEVVPDDLDSSWLVVPVPVGKRTLVVAGYGKTCRFTRGGYNLGDFKSVLGLSCRETVLDCIFVPAQGTFYVLDVMVINGHPLYDCDTNTRFDWGKSQVMEVDGIGERTYSNGRRTNVYAFKPLEHYAADKETLRSLLSEEDNFCFARSGDSSMEGSSGFRPAPLDGILFYHRELNYMPGHTPLVSWLKGYMVPEMLGVGVGNTLMAQKPANYAGMQAEIKEFETKYAQKKEKIKAKESKTGDRDRGGNWRRSGGGEHSTRQNFHRGPGGGNKRMFNSDGNFNRMDCDRLDRGSSSSSSQNTVMEMRVDRQAAPTAN